jgi:uncharacterized membrane protein
VAEHLVGAMTRNTWALIILAGIFVGLAWYLVYRVVG